MSRPFGRCLTQTVALALAGFGAAHSACAHPHVRINVEVIFVVEHGAVGTIRHRWTFDEDFRRSNFAEFDVNQNGILEEAEIAAFRDQSLITLKDFNSFTVVSQGTVEMKLGEPVIVRFDMLAAKPVYEFDVALSQPVPLTSKGVSIEIYDPTYFTAFDFDSAHAVSVEARDGTICSAALISPPRNGAQMKEYRAYVSAFGPPSAKLVTPRSITLKCQPAASPSGKANVREGAGR